MGLIHFGFFTVRFFFHSEFCPLGLLYVGVLSVEGSYLLGDLFVGFLSLGVISTLSFVHWGYCPGGMAFSIGGFCSLGILSTLGFLY